MEIVVFNLSPLICSILFTSILFVTFQIGRWHGIKIVMKKIETEMERMGD